MREILNQARSFNWRFIPLKVTIVYMLVGVLWILLSDWAMDEIIRNPEAADLLQENKFWVYIAVTATMLYVLIYADVAAIRRSQDAVFQQLMLINLLNQVTRAIADRQDLVSILGVVLQQLEDRMPIDFGTICLVDSTNQSLTLSSFGDRSRSLSARLQLKEGDTIGFDASGLQESLRGGGDYFPDTTKTKGIFTERLVKCGLRSFVAVPLRSHEEDLGILVAARKPLNGFNPAEIEFLRVLNEHVALAAHQAQLYENLLKAYENLRQAQNLAEQQQRLRALGQMASGIAHDFNNALSPIVGFTELLLLQPEDLDEEKRTRYLKIIRTASQDAASIVRRLREFYRQRDQSEVFLPIKLNQLIDQVIPLTQPRWKDQSLASGVTINVTTDLQPIPLVLGNESELREALMNLIFNAVDAMPGGGTINISTRVCQTDGATSQSDEGAERKTATLPEQTVVLSISDSGEGMSDQTRVHCLEPFYTTKGDRGTGLGLALVYGIVRRHEGRIDIESELGKGTTFHISFPVQASETEPLPLMGMDDGPRRPLRILVVDDDELVREVQFKYLTGDGHTVETASNGREGLERFHSGWFDLVVTDRGMPEMNGDQLIAAIKQIAPKKPTILLTGFGDIMKATGEIPHGVSFILSKPVTLSALRHAVAAAVDNLFDPDAMENGENGGSSHASVA